MKQILTISILVILSLSLNSCRLTDFTVITTKNVPLDTEKSGPRSTGKGWTVKDAIDAAIEKAGPEYNALIDGVIYEGLLRYKVVGTPIKIK
jgi:hypothetical protein